MNRVRFPLIAMYINEGGVDRYAKEDFDEQGFGKTDDPLLATVYTSSKHFSKFFGESASHWLRRHEVYAIPGHGVELIYVGDKA